MTGAVTRGQGEALIHKGWGCSSYLLAVKKVVLVPLRLFSIKSSTAGAFSVPFGVSSRKNMTGDNVLCKSWYLLGEKKISSRANKTGSWYLLRGSLQNFQQAPTSFLHESSPCREGCNMLGTSVAALVSL